MVGEGLCPDTVDPHSGDARVWLPPTNRRSQIGQLFEFEHALLGVEQTAVVRIGEDLSAPLSVVAVPRHDAEVYLGVDVHQECMVVLVGLEQRIKGRVVARAAPPPVDQQPR